MNVRTVFGLKMSHRKRRNCPPSLPQTSAIKDWVNIQVCIQKQQPSVTYENVPTQTGVKHTNHLSPLNGSLLTSTFQIESTVAKLSSIHLACKVTAADYARVLLYKRNVSPTSVQNQLGKNNGMFDKSNRRTGPLFYHQYQLSRPPKMYC